MRIKFGDKIYLCTKVSCPVKDNVLIITTSNGIYTVDMVTSKEAEIAFDKLLINGYLDVSEYQYNN